MSFAPLAAAGAERDAALFAPSRDVPHVRVMTWNIAGNSVFADPGARFAGRGDGGRPARFRRLLQAIRPDVVCLQEVFAPRGKADIARILDDALPQDDGARWHAHGEPDIVIAARFPLSMHDARTEDWGGGVPRTHAMALVDLPNALGSRDLYVLCAHLQSRSEAKDIAARQAQADAIVAGLRDLRRLEGGAALLEHTPIALLGDWNAYRTDPARHVETLLGGEIANRERFGAGIALDWDHTALRDARPLHNTVGPATYTFGDGSAAPFPPAEVDRVLFTDSVLGQVGAFVLDTTTLEPATLARHGLQATDVLYAAEPRTFDHLPVVVDFEVRLPAVPGKTAAGRNPSRGKSCI